MEALKEISESKYVFVVLSLLESLQKVEKSAKSKNVLLSRYCRMSDPPRLEIVGNIYRFEFDVSYAFGGGEFQPVVEVEWMPHALEQTVHDLNDSKGIRQIRIRCDCGAMPSDVCPHLMHCLDFLRKGLSSRSPEQGYRWIRSLVADGREAGQKLLASLTVPPTEANANLGLSRLQWRIRINPESPAYYEPFSVAAYLQQEKKKGGWTKGKRLREIFDQAPESAFVHPNDRMIASLLTVADDSFDSFVVREALLLLCDHPNVVYDDDALAPLHVCKTAMEVRVESDGDLFRPKLYLGDTRLDDNPVGFTMGQVTNNNYLGLLYDRSRGVLWFSDLDRSMVNLYRSLREATRRKAALDKPMAEQLADILAHASNKQVALNLPEELAGPEKPLEPAIEMHLTPNGNMGLQVALRVTCDATHEPPVPGIGPERLRINTPAGRFQLIRHLEGESTNADLVATQCVLGSLAFDGPYTWIAETDDAALDMLDRVRLLGEQAPVVCWPKSKPMRLVGDITPQRLRVQLTSQRDWFGLDGIADLDGLEISLAELLVALRAGRRYVPLGDGQFASISDQLRQRLTTLHDLSQSETGQVRISRAATPILKDILSDDIHLDSDPKWEEALERLEQVRRFKPVVPAELKADLRDYQRAGYEWLARLGMWGLGGCLADDMGLGKTVQALGILLDRAAAGPALVIAPTSVGINWTREVARFAPSLRPLLYREHERQLLIDQAGPGDLVITSFQLLQRDAERFASRTWHTLVIDEAQFIKNFQTKTAKAVRDIEADWVLALTGTPLENHLGELWSLMRTVCPGLLGSWERFRKQFAEPIERDHDRDRLQSLSRVVQPFILRRTKKEVLTELPPRTEILRTAELSPAERNKYDAARIAALSELSGGNQNDNEQQRRIRVLAWLTRMRQLACHPRLVDPKWTLSSAKLDLFMEIVEELREGEHRALVFSQFVQHLSLVREALDNIGIKYQYLDGATPTNKRQDAVDAFQRGEGDLFLISLKAGGTGLNLTAADYVLHLDPWWNPAVEDQATDRAHRIGQTQAVTVYRLVAKDTIEEQILAMHEDKRELIAGVLDGADRASKMSTDDLIKLIRLNQLQS